jgi:hypothetical protein
MMEACEMANFCMKFPAFSDTGDKVVLQQDSTLGIFN